MATQGRSLDDLPLTAYTTGMRPDEVDEPVEEFRPAVDVERSMPMEAVAELAPGPDDELDSPADADGVPILVRAKAFAAQNPRVAAGGVFVTMIAVGVLLLGGGGAAPPASGATATQSAPPIVAVAPDPGAVTLTLTGALNAELALTGTAGAAPTGATAVAASWSDTLQNSLSLAGPIDRGTRTTDARLVLSLTVMINGAPVTFTSRAGECTIGMAVQPNGVTGSLTCRKVRSADGKLTLNASGTYRT
jgi:hypothetical protein